MNHRQILEEYWQQLIPGWQIPNGFHVHHIIPRHCGGTDDPRNLIALHPDDHTAIHRHRGDKVADNGFIVAAKTGDENVARRPEVREKISQSLRGQKKTAEHKRKLSHATLRQFETKGHPREGAILSAETKDKIRKANIGKTYSKEVNSKKGKGGNNNAASKSVTIDGIHYESIRAAMKETGLSRERIRKIERGVL